MKMPPKIYSTIAIIEKLAQKLTQVSHPPAQNLLNYQEKLDS
jgi:hypothetical protein